MISAKVSGSVLKQIRIMSGIALKNIKSPQMIRAATAVCIKGGI